LKNKVKTLKEILRRLNERRRLQKMKNLLLVKKHKKWKLRRIKCRQLLIKFKSK